MCKTKYDLGIWQDDKTLLKYAFPIGARDSVIVNPILPEIAWNDWIFIKIIPRGSTVEVIRRAEANRVEVELEGKNFLTADWAIECDLNDQQAEEPVGQGTVDTDWLIGELVRTGGFENKDDLIDRWCQLAGLKKPGK